MNHFVSALTPYKSKSTNVNASANYIFKKLIMNSFTCL